MTEQEYLEAVYLMNGNSFSGFKEYESLPLEDWYIMLLVHNRVVDRQRET